MINYTTISTAFTNIVGFRENEDVPISTSLETSTSGLYVNDEAGMSLKTIYNSLYRYASTSLPDIDTYFRTTQSTMIKFLPPLNSIKFVGIYEDYENEVKRLAEFLGKPFIKPDRINKCNYLHIPDQESIDIFKENNKFIYQLYEYSIENDRVKLESKG